MCQPLALAFWPQAMAISCKGAKTLGSESLKPVIDVRTHSSMPAAATEPYGRRSHLPERHRESERPWISFSDTLNKFLVHMRAVSHTLHEVPRTGPWAVRWESRTGADIAQQRLNWPRRRRVSCRGCPGRAPTLSPRCSQALITGPHSVTGPPGAHWRSAGRIWAQKVLRGQHNVF